MNSDRFSFRFLGSLFASYAVATAVGCGSTDESSKKPDGAAGSEDAHAGAAGRAGASGSQDEPGGAAGNAGAASEPGGAGGLGSVAGAPGNGAGATGDDFTGERGRFIGAEHLSAQSVSTIRQQLEFIGSPFDARFDVDIYRISYESIGVDSDPILLSALLAIPKDSDGPLPLLSYQHGTVVTRSGAPSMVGSGALLIVSNQESFIGVALASRGYVAVLPDYVGLGLSTEYPTYLHAATEASAVVDALRAARGAAASLEVEVSQRLFLLGYSQGGHATMAAHRALERDEPEEFTIVASAPMSGPYDLSGVSFAASMSSQPTPTPFPVPYLLLTLNQVYDLVPNDSSLFSEDVADTLPDLFDWETPGDVINEAMVPAGEPPPKVAVDSLNPDLLSALAEDSDHPMRTALRDNDVYDWTPVAPVHLYYCTGDTTVPPQNAEIAYAAFEDRGADVTLIEPEVAAGGDHIDCFVPSVAGAQAWFEALR